MKHALRVTVASVAIILAAIAASAQSVGKIESELMVHVRTIKKYSAYGPSRDYDRLGKENAAFSKKLRVYAKLTRTLGYSFPSLSKEIFISTSRDGKFRIYSWDTEEGGTMHDYKSVFQYQGKSGKVRSWSFPESEDFSVGGFYHQIFQVNTGQGNVYLANSTFILSNPLAMQELEVFRIDGERLNTNMKMIRTNSGLTGSISFEYDFFSVVDHPERPIRLFSFDPERKNFDFPLC